MAEYSANAVQVVAPGESVVFTDSPVPCDRNFVRFREGSGNFLLSGWVPGTPGCGRQRICKCEQSNQCGSLERLLRNGFYKKH